MGKKQVTFADIAEYTHFSKTTISPSALKCKMGLIDKIFPKIAEPFDRGPPLTR